MLMLYYKYSTLYDILEQTYTHFSAVKPGAKALKAPHILRSLVLIKPLMPISYPTGYDTVTPQREEMRQSH